MWIETESNMTRKTHFVLLILLLTSGLVTLATAGLPAGTTAPDFTLPTTTAEKISLSQFKGQVVILAFWKSDWRQCHAEIPHLNEISKQYPDSLVKILSLNAINPAPLAANDGKRYEISYPILLCRDTGVIRDYQITKLPHLFIIDQKGVIRESKLFLEADKIKKILDGLLAEWFSG
jgi:peroxiredoxin